MADTLDVPVLTEAEVIAKLASEFGIPEGDITVSFDIDDDERGTQLMEILIANDERDHVMPRTRAAMYKLIENETRGSKKV